VKKQTKRAGSAKPLAGKCAAKLTKANRGRFCDADPLEDRTRCRLHGGATPREAALNATKHGGYAKSKPIAAAPTAVLSEPFGLTEKALIREWRRDPEEGIKQTLAEVLVVQRRALRAGAMEIYARLTTAAGTLSRAIASLHEIPPADPSLPGIEFVYGDKREDFADDMSRQPAEVSS
jgi:hypothetical protein